MHPEAAELAVLQICLQWTEVFPQLLPLEPAFSWAGGLYPVSLPGSPPCPLQVSGFLSLHNHVSQFLITNTCFLYLYTENTSRDTRTCV